MGKPGWSSRLAPCRPRAPACSRLPRQGLRQAHRLPVAALDCLHTRRVLGARPPGRYIEYESKLEELRSSRRKSRGISGKKALAEFCITRRIHFIYERATRKFRWGRGPGCVCVRWVCIWWVA